MACLGVTVQTQCHLVKLQGLSLTGGLTATYKSCEKEVRDLKRKQENLNQYLGRTQTDPVQEQFKKKNNPIL